MPADLTHRRILVVDDTPNIHDDFRKILAAPNPRESALPDLESAMFDEAPSPEPIAIPFQLSHAYQGQEAYDLVSESLPQNHPFQVAFVDMRMPPGWDGLETIRHLWQADPRLQVVICTAYSDHSWTELSQSLGSTDSLIILKKPFDNIEVVQLAHSLSRKWELARAAELQVAQLDAKVASRTLELRAAETQFKEAFDASPLAQCIQSLTDARIVEINAAYSRHFNLTREAAIGLTPEEFGRGVNPEDWRENMDRLARGESIDDLLTNFQFPGEPPPPRTIRNFGRLIHFEGRPHCLWVIQDITDQINLERQLRQTQKMEAIGQLAAGVAHDFNNVMTAVQGFTQISLERTDLAPDLRQDLEQVLAAGRRASALTRQLLLFSRKQVLQETDLDINEVITDIDPLLRRLVGSTFEIIHTCGTELPLVRADQANIEQVVLNLVANARDALGRLGRIEIILETASVEKAASLHNPDASPGDYVKLSVRDNGPGIPADVLPRIFDPFFTTKPVGEGTGLGLATCYGIARQHRGWIDVETAPNIGTTFSIYLPAVIGPRENSPADFPLIGIPKNRDELRGTERILIVEDDPVVAQLISCVLRRHGYDTTCAENGPAALELWDSRGGFDLVFSDMVMPKGMSGAELAEALIAKRPDVPIILATGYSADLIQATVPQALLDRCTLLLKPYDIGKLLTRMRQLLSANAE